MARIRPGGADDGEPASGGGKPRKGRKPRRARPRVKHPRAAKAPKAAQRGPAPEPVSAGGAWSHAAAAPGSISPLAPLDPAALVAPDPLTLTGAERGSVHEALAAWGRQRDQALNRVWRRPGGLVRPAGL